MRLSAHVMAVPTETGGGVAGGPEPPDVDAGDWIWGL